jgi:predicted kinase
MNFAYRTAVETAELNIRYGDPVVIAATFSRDSFKAPLRSYCDRFRTQVKIRIFRLELPEEGREQVVLDRIERRRAAGDPAVIDSLEKYQWGRTNQMPWWEGAGVIELDASRPLETVCQQIMWHTEDLHI